MKGLALVALAVAGLVAGPVAAQGIGEGVLNAVAYKDLPAATSISVRVLDNSDNNMVLAAEFERALRGKGFAVGDGGELVLTFETRDDVGAWSDSGRRSIIELEARGGRGGGENASAIVNIFNSSRGGMLNEGRGGTTITTPTQYRIDATIDERDGGRRVWHGWSVADLGQADGLALTRGMVPVIVGAVGRTVRREPFVIP